MTNTKKNRLNVFFFLLLLFGFSPLFSVGGGDKAIKNDTLLKQKKLMPLYMKANKMLTQNRLDDAELNLNKCLSILSSHPESHFLLAQILYRRNQLDQALQAIENAEKNHKLLAEDLARSREDFVRLKQNQLISLRGQEKDLEETLTMFCGGNPGRVPYESSLIAVRSSIRGVEQQLSSSGMESDDFPADYVYFHGNIFFKQGRLPEALAQYEAAVRIDPTHSNAFNNMALVLHSLGRDQEALACLVRAQLSGAKVNPDFKKALEKKIGSLYPD